MPGEPTMRASRRLAAKNSTDKKSLKTLKSSAASASGLNTATPSETPEAEPIRPQNYDDSIQE